MTEFKKILIAKSGLDANGTILTEEALKNAKFNKILPLTTDFYSNKIIGSVYNITYSKGKLFADVKLLEDIVTLEDHIIRCCYKSLKQDSEGENTKLHEIEIIETGLLDKNRDAHIN